MSVPTKPYATSSQVSVLLPALTHSAIDFSSYTTPKKDSVDVYLTWVSNQMDLQFQMAGYVLPLQPMQYETWPDHQNYYLELVAALGAAALAGGYVLKPAPATPRGSSGSTGNVFQEMYNAELAKIWDGKRSQIRFRALYYAGTAAERAVIEPGGPQLDYMMGYMNPEDKLFGEDYVSLQMAIQDYIKPYVAYQRDFNWQSFYSLYQNRLLTYGYP